jgi:ferredoxin/flavodoxin---NADP+ reductase
MNDSNTALLQNSVTAKACDAFFVPDKPICVRKVDNLSAGTYILKFDRHGMPFRAGQCLSIGLPNSGINREYSIYSGENDDYLEVLIREVKTGNVSPALRKCKVGDVLEIFGPYSEFVISSPEDRSRKYVFIGTGTGIAPYRSFIRSYPSLNYTIIHGIRYQDEQYNCSEYLKSRYIPCLTKDKVSGTFHGRVTDYLVDNRIAPNTYCYLCGNRAMIEEVYELLRCQGLPSDNIITEVFF